MDKCTHDVRRANWLNIINQCQERPANVTVHQWLKDNDIKEKSYYYWLRKFRKESYDQMKLPVTTENPAEISFVEIAAPVTSEKTIQTQSSFFKIFPVFMRLFNLYVIVTPFFSPKK